MVGLVSSLKQSLPPILIIILAAIILLVLPSSDLVGHLFDFSALAFLAVLFFSNEHVQKRIDEVVAKREEKTGKQITRYMRHKLNCPTGILRAPSCSGV